MKKFAFAVALVAFATTLVSAAEGAKVYLPNKAETAKIETALALLQSIGITDVPALDAAGCQNFDAMACVVMGEDRTIHLTKEALRANPKDLAAIIAHERVHALGDRHEGPGYDEELRVLKLLKGSGEAFGRVRAGHELHRFDYPR